MTRKEEIRLASIKYADEHPSDYTNEMYDIADIEKAFKAGAEWAYKTAWKPSDEQMLALEAKITIPPQSPAMTSALIELYNDLKQL